MVVSLEYPLSHLSRNPTPSMSSDTHRAHIPRRSTSSGFVPDTPVPPTSAPVSFGVSATSTPPSSGGNPAPPPPAPSTSSRMAVSYLLNSNSSNASGHAYPQSMNMQPRVAHPGPMRTAPTMTPSSHVASSSSTRADLSHAGQASTMTRTRTDRASSSSRSREVPYASPALQCEICKKTFKDRGNLRKHRKSVHTSDPRPFSCTVAGCNKSFSFKDGLTRHILTVHDGIRPFHCTVPGCGMSFKQRTHLAKHVQHRHKPE